jgi:hypothetical protein
MEHRKKERKSIEKEKKKEKEKEEEKEKLQESPQIKGKSIFWEEKNTSTSKIFFDVIFSPFIIPFQKPFPKSLRVFLALSGSSFNLAIYMTWVVPFILIHELHIFSL